MDATIKGKKDTPLSEQTHRSSLIRMVENISVDGSGTSWKRSRRILGTRKGLDEGDIEQQRTRIIRSFEKRNIYDDDVRK